MTPDFEQICVQALLADSAVTAIVGDRVGTRTPREFADPWVTVRLIDDVPDARSSALHLVTALVQIDCYASAARNGGQAEASLLARTCRTVLHRLAYDTQTSGPVVSKVKPGRIRPLPDETLEPARERYVLDVEVTAHG